MKTGRKLLLLALVPLGLLLESCQKQKAFASFETNLPQPSAVVTKVTLNEEQQGYVQSGNHFSFTLLDAMFKGESLLISPLSVQFALSMAVNGARGETADEITNALGYGKGATAAINTYSKSLMDQLPAVDGKVMLRLANAIIVNSPYQLDGAFQSAVRDNYYAPAEVVPFTEPDVALDALNAWASRNTDGMINPLLDHIHSNDGIAYLLGAVCFKAPWQEQSGHHPMFDPKNTVENADFLLGGGEVAKVDYMKTQTAFPYVDAADFSMVSIPYANGHYCMYVLLPKEESQEAVRKLVSELDRKDWKAMTASMKEVDMWLSLPKFSTESSYNLKEPLRALGINAAFGKADFSTMLSGDKTPDGIAEIIQKNRINITEWGTEAASVSSTLINEATSDGKDHHPLIFNANHPFVYVIAEKSSDVIIFEGVFSGE